MHGKRSDGTGTLNTSGQFVLDRSRMNPKIRFVIEILVLWVLFCLPINLLTIFLSSVAPSYDHEEADQKSAQANEQTYHQIQNASILV
ncbi:hypothetical protein TCAL_14401 [Tigriopus californicus]|uniref:Uncharacterized protein n=1 Tax=Tigriopus californicus TaxID=6832 RepID=A0A553PK91_TIGCA|nr:hypothetical protein TCAL_14401 [Tigriopus californicus]